MAKLPALFQKQRLISRGLKNMGCLSAQTPGELDQRADDGVKTSVSQDLDSLDFGRPLPQFHTELSFAQPPLMNMHVGRG